MSFLSLLRKVVLAGVFPPAMALPAATVAHAMPLDEGMADPQAIMSVNVTLKLPDEGAFDRAVQALYDPSSATYRHWMTQADLLRFAPKPEAVARVRAALEKHGLRVIDADANGFVLRVRGTVQALQDAFQTTVHQFRDGERVFRSDVQRARLTDGADAFVQQVSGLEERSGLLERRSKVLLRKRLRGQMGSQGGRRFVPNDSSSLDTKYSGTCFARPQTFTVQTPNQSVPVGVFFGNVYQSGVQSADPVSCGFSAAELREQLGLPAIYAKGWTGKGQTIVIPTVLAYPNLLADLNKFAAMNNLPAMDSTTLSVVYPEGVPPVAYQWQYGPETTTATTVQAIHTMVPDAKIVVVAGSNYFDADLAAAINYAVENKLGNVFALQDADRAEAMAGSPDFANEVNGIFRRAAAMGIAVQVPTGNEGDDQVGSALGSSSELATSPYVTAVGGTAILKGTDGSAPEVVWGSYVTILYLSQGILQDPPYQQGTGLFLDGGGSGGGESQIFGKPSWQAALPGSGRQTPDISSLADPFTGFAIVSSDQYGDLSSRSSGGTELAAALVSSLWALADEAAGHSLGQAAPAIAKMTGNAIRDVVPLSSPTDAAGVIFDRNKVTRYSARDLFSEYRGIPAQFYSALAPYVDPNYGFGLDVLTFGTDSPALVATPGWDNATGYGVPNGLAFVEAAIQ
ncbi:MAG: hypothetical protein INR62_01710 [Rhodospirillales bacterium]|nr:hypothetical protein [Acetobacter sp.]